MQNAFIFLLIKKTSVVHADRIMATFTQFKHCESTKCEFSMIIFAHFSFIQLVFPVSKFQSYLDGYDLGSQNGMELLNDCKTHFRQETKPNYLSAPKIIRSSFYII